MKLLIFYLSDNGRHFTFPHFVNLLNESNQQNDWKLIVLTHDDNLDFYRNILASTTITYDVFNFNSHQNYLEKVRFAIQYAKQYSFPYMMKCDNDLFYRGRTLDYMMNHLELLENPANLTLGPLLSSGIPCIEYFMNDFLNESDRTILQQKLLETRMEDLWGATYNHLNKYTIEASSWNGKAFFQAVQQNSHHYKGIHPIRVNLDAIKYLNQCIIQNKDEFYKDNDLSIIYDSTSPYLCNSVFCIKTSIYESIVYDSSLYVDPFDEVPLNKYAWKMGMSHLFVKNGYGLHMYYNTVPNNRAYEKEFCDSFFK
jgi:hypothetical protein